MTPALVPMPPCVNPRRDGSRCRTCWYCQQTEAPLRAKLHDPNSTLADLVDAAFAVGLRVIAPVLVPIGGPYAAGWRKWGGPKK
jgi:hypothetical protein